MRKKTYVPAAFFLAAAILAGGCSDSKERYAFRETGIEQLNAGEYDAAIQSFEQAIASSNGLVGEFELDVLKYRAEAEYKAGDFAASAYTYDVLCQVDEERPEYRIRSCIMNSRAGEVDKALEDYEKAAAGTAGMEELESAILSLGQALIDAGRYDEAVTLCEGAAASGWGSAELYNQLGLGQMELGNYDAALEYLERGIHMGDEAVMPQLLYNQAAAYEKKLDFASALTVLEDYVSRFGSTPEVEKEIAFLKTR